MIKPSIIEFLSDPLALGPHFAGPSWDRWKACLKAAYALQLDSRDRELFAEVSGNRRAPQRPVSELVCLIGRAGGKDSVAAALAVYVAVTSDFSRLRPGEKGSILCLANDREQAAIAFNYIRGLFEEIPMLAAMIERITADTIDLDNGAQIIVATNSFRAVRGRTICCVIMDEVCFWRSDDYADPDVEVDAAVGPGLARFHGAIKILISSTYRRAGLAYGKWKASFGKDDDDTLVILGTTRQFNPGFPQRDIDRDIARDPDRYRAEYLSEWRDDLRAYIDRAAIEACVTWGCFERAPRAGIKYMAFIDVSGGRSDSYCWAIGHVGSNGRYVVDLVREVIPPFSPDAATKECAADCRRYGISSVTGDNYGGEWPAERSRNHGVNYERSLVVRSDIYKAFLPEVNAGRVDLIECDRGINQFCQLERKVQRSGADTIGHPNGAHDDVANVIAGCVWLLASSAEPAAWHRDALMADGGAPAAVPRMVAYHAVTIAAADRGRVGVVYWGVRPVYRVNLLRNRVGALTVLDADLLAMGPDLASRISGRVDDLQSRCPGSGPADLAVGDEVLGEFLARSGLRLRLLEDVPDVEELAPFATTAINSRLVRIGELAMQTAGRVPLGAILDAVNDADDPIRTAFLQGLWGLLRDQRTGVVVADAVSEDDPAPSAPAAAVAAQPASDPIAAAAAPPASPGSPPLQSCDFKSSPMGRLLAEVAAQQRMTGYRHGRF